MRSHLALSCSGDVPDRIGASSRTHAFIPPGNPLALVERAIRNSRKTRDIVLDRFAGSGSILMARARANRQARRIEVDPKYCGVRRWQVLLLAACRAEPRVTSRPMS
jgi:DNA methylase